MDSAATTFSNRNPKAKGWGAMQELYKFRNLWHSSKQEEGPCTSTMSASASRGFID